MTGKVAPSKHSRSGWGWAKLSAIALLFLLLSLFPMPVAAAQALSHPGAKAEGAVSAVANIRIVPQRTESLIAPIAFGVNDAVWDWHLLDPQVPALLRADGVRVMRYPGGSTADVFHWQSNTIEPGNTDAGPVTFDRFMQIVREVGATAMITVNYGSGTPQEAAAWVQYANITHHYGIKFWEIGNEVYGNGTYGANWEYDTHAQKGPAAYASNALQFIRAMKAVDPTIKVGIVLTMPGDWPDGVIAPGDSMDWNHTVLSIVGSQIDFAAVHWYTDTQQPGTESDAGLLNNVANVPAKVATLRALFRQYCGPRADHIQIMVTETNSVPYNPGKQTVSLVNALFLAEDYMAWLQNGALNVDWWDVHNGIVTWGNNSPSLYGTADYGDYGLLSVGGTADAISEPPAETPFPTYYGLQMLHKLAGPFDRIVAASSDQSLVKVYAVRRRDGSLSILLINTDPATTYQARLSVTGGPGAHLPQRVVRYFYGEDSTAISVEQLRGAVTSAPLLPPYSLTVLVYQPTF